MSSTTNGHPAESVDGSTTVRAPAQAGRNRRRAVRHAGPPEGKAEAPDPVVLTKSAGPIPESAPAESATERIATSGPSSVSVAAPMAPSTGSASPAAEPRPRSRPRFSLGWGLTGLLIVALLAATVVLLFDHRSAQERDNRRQAFVDTARQTVLNLTTIHPETAKEDVDRIVAGASGEFLDEFRGREGPFVDVVKAAEVTTTGEIVEAGIESETNISAKVLVAARTMVTSADQPAPSPRDFRMRVTVSEVDGKLTASKVEFVP
ncbi:hypothetical protein BFN03_14600 [Rhodococcus sp. WMMA185]|nr:hypothetical protein BFN03_14600 [Rhodococcus sp. WMMA185]